MKIKCWICGKSNRFTNPDIVIDKERDYVFKCGGIMFLNVGVVA